MGIADAGPLQAGRRALYASLRRVPGLKPLAQRLGWQRHIWGDALAAFVPQWATERLTPYSFWLASGHAVANQLMLTGQFETAEVDLMARLLGESDVFVDVGANVGLYTCLARQSGVVAVAIEPQRQNLNYLFRNLRRNGWEDTEVLPVALGAGPGLVDLFGASGPSASLVRGWAGYSPRFRQVVPMTTLDALVANRFPGRRLLIKVDVEGAEYGVLQGAAETLAREPKPSWMMEVVLGEYHPGGANPHFARVFEMFWEHGYEARPIAHLDRVLTPEEVWSWSRTGGASPFGFNYLFAPPPAS